MTFGITGSKTKKPLLCIVGWAKNAGRIIGVVVIFLK